MFLVGELNLPALKSEFGHQNSRASFFLLVIIFLLPSCCQTFVGVTLSLRACSESFLDHLAQAPLEGSDKLATQTTLRFTIDYYSLTSFLEENEMKWCKAKQNHS